jgi:hypothetical protein
VNELALVSVTSSIQKRGFGRKQTPLAVSNNEQLPIPIMKTFGSLRASKYMEERSEEA